MKLPDNFQMREHSRQCRFHIITKCKVWNKNKYSGDHSLSRVVVPVTLHSISVNVHFTRFLGSGHANLLSKYRTHPTENIWRETSVEGKYREANDGEYWGCTAGVGHGNRGSRDYEECNIPEIDTSDSPDIPRRKRRGINVRTEVEVSVWEGKTGPKTLKRHGNGTRKWASQRLQGIQYSNE
jgi:hypothetical protein